MPLATIMLGGGLELVSEQAGYVDFMRLITADGYVGDTPLRVWWSSLKLGAHVSIAGGVHKAPERARSVTCDCMQIFSKNQMQWDAKPLGKNEVEKFKEGLDKNGIREVVIHGSYLVNLGSPKKDDLKRSREAFLDEMERARTLGVRKLIFHPGAHKDSGEQKGLRTIAESLNWLRSRFGSSDVHFILETTAGQGTYLGHSFEQLAKILDQLDDKKSAGICFDTCHAYAAGYDIKTRNGYNKTFEKLDDVVGLDKLAAIHLNDSKSKLGSRVDRHEQIGEGQLGLAPFKMLMNDDRFEDVPMVLETPEGETAYEKELMTLRSMMDR